MGTTSAENKQAVDNKRQKPNPEAGVIWCVWVHSIFPEY